VVAIGETGLDFCRDFSPREAQVAAFRAQLALAEELGLPVVVHCRAAQETLLAILRERPPTGLVWHCFDGSREQARAAIELGAALGFTGSVTYRESDELRRVAAELPEDRLLLETDCPYLGPEPRRKGDNEPGNLPLIAQAVAKARATSMEGMLNTTTINARRVFCLGRT
jgi:TatD DNase family protein